VNTNSPKPPVIVVGGGWAGLTTAVELARQRVPVTLLESAKQLGGRARCVHLAGERIDNGQHLLLGAYRFTLELLHLLGVKEEDAFLRRPLALHYRHRRGHSVKLNTPRLPAPLHLAWGLVMAKGLSWRDRLGALRFSRAMERKEFEIAEDCSVAALLAEHNQSAALIEGLWEPLCVGALNTHLHEASAQLFLRVLSDSFQHARRDSDLLITRMGLGAMLPEPAFDFIESHGGSVRLGQRVGELLLDADGVGGVAVGNRTLPGAQVVLATPPTMALRLMEPHPALREVAARLTRLSHRPICTVYLQYPDAVSLGMEMQGSLGTVSQWIFDRRSYGQAGLMAVVISGEGEHMAWDNEALCDHVAGELAQQFPHWPAPLKRLCIREKRATFAATVGVNALRPAQRTPVKGLWLAGDYTATGLPATLEGAVRSGLTCAREIIQQR
jgi:squalene-associated FAD-dependent desaturase